MRCLRLEQAQGLRRGKFAMTGVDERADVVVRAGSETMLRFVMTLIVTTGMVAVTAWVLSYALLATERTTRGATAAVQHVRL